MAFRRLRIHYRCGAAADSLHGRPAQAGQQLHRALEKRPAARADLSLRDDPRWPDVRKARELRPGAHRRPTQRKPGLLRWFGAPHKPGKETARTAQAAHRDHRPESRPRPRDRGLQARLRDRHGPGPRPPGVLHSVLHGAHARPEDQGRRSGRGTFHRGGRPQAPPRGQPRHHGQLPGRLGVGPAVRRPARYRGAAHPERRPHVLLGRRAGSEPDALPGRTGRRHLDDFASV